jgi:predicted enzyme related to lactoylglutathione lyase
MKLEQIILATTNMAGMVSFYNEVFDAQLIGHEPMMGVIFYNGKLAGIPMQLCPNEVAQVEAKQNRQQFYFSTDDLDATLTAALAHGGMQIAEIAETEDGRLVGIYDPDGNSIIFRQPFQ